MTASTGGLTGYVRDQLRTPLWFLMRGGVSAHRGRLDSADRSDHLHAQHPAGRVRRRRRVRAGAALGAVTQLAGAGSTAICADLGARTIREEIDALEVLGIYWRGTR